MIKWIKEYIKGVLSGYEWISFKIGRCRFGFFYPLAIFNWEWKGHGYDGLWDEYSFGFILQVSRDSDYLLSLIESKD